MTQPDLSRHRSPADFQAMLQRGTPFHEAIHGDPRVTLFADPARQRIGIRGPNEAVTPTTSLEHVSVRRIADDGGPVIEIAVTQPALFTEAYPVLCAVADRIQIDGYRTGDALHETLRRYGHLLHTANAISLEEETGLIGEFAVLRGLAVALGPAAAIGSWRGQLREEHDFGLPHLDIEVKTTTAEQPQHWITSLTQLVPTGTRPLWLLSLQITQGGEAGAALADLITDIRRMASPLPSALAAFNQALHATRWRDLPERPHRRWLLRHPPTPHLVTDRFPRITPHTLAAAGIDLLRVTSVQYRIDLSALSPDDPVDPLTDALTATTLEIP